MKIDFKQTEPKWQKRWEEAGAFRTMVEAAKAMLESTPGTEPPEEYGDTLRVAGGGYAGQFSPFFSETAYDQEAMGLTQLPLLTSDREGMVVLRGIEGETRGYNGVDYTYNYDADGAWKTSNYTALTGTDLWTAADTADPFKAFKAAKDAIRSKTGAELVTAIMNTATFNMLASTNAVKNRYLTTSGFSLSYLTDQEVKAVVSGTAGLNIAIYDKQYRDEDKVAHSFVPDGYVCLIPAGNLGSTWYGTTPEEADLMGADSNAQVSIVNTGVAITRIIEEHPVNVNIFASEIVLPSFERMDEVAVLKVIA